MTDKRSVHTDALATLGSIIGESEKRDAIHLAVEPTVAVEKLNPGQDVGVDGSRANPVGIVDPFLKQPVLPGERFWLIVYPRQITSLRHVWEHPAFTAAAETKAESDKWLRDFLRERDALYDEEDFQNVMSAATDGPHTGDLLCVGGTVIYGEIPTEFWDHAEVVSGKKIEGRPKYFSCTC